MKVIRLLLVVALLFAWGEARAQAPACTFGPGALPADTLPAGGLHGDAMPIQHIVVMMQENRSYDHYFGHLRKKYGPPPGTTNPDPLGGPPIKPFHQTSY